MAVDCLAQMTEMTALMKIQQPLNVHLLLASLSRMSLNEKLLVLSFQPGSGQFLSAERSIHSAQSPSQAVQNLLLL